MRRTHRLTARLIRWTSLSVSFALVLSCFVVTPLAKPNHNSKALAQQQGGSQNANAKKVEPAPPVTGPPAANLPNLDEVKQRHHEAPRAPEPVSSTLRSRHKPLESRHGRKVGDPLPPRKVSSYRTESDSEPVSNAGAKTLPMSKVSVRSHHARTTRLRLTRPVSPASSSWTEYGHRSFIAGPEPQGPPNSATFVATDTATQGNWKGAYGADGYNVINDAASYPSYAQVSVSGQSAYTWVASTSDARAPLKAASSTDRIAPCWYSYTNFTVDVNLTDGNEHKVSVYSLDWDGNNSRSERIEILDAATNAVLDTRDVGSYSNGKYSVWNLRGHVKIRATNLGSQTTSNAVISALFFDSAASTSASFIQTDTTTQGNWKGAYGAEGYNVINDATSYPAYAQVSVSGQSAYTWAASTSDARALLKSASATDRIAPCWYSFTNFTVDMNLTDGNEHKVAVYSLDWDGNNGRQQQIQVLDAGTNAVLDSRNVLSFSGGQYTVWKLRGHVKLQVNFLGPAGANAVISGLFFDASSSSRTNYALASNGATASASSTLTSNYPSASVNNGDRKGTNWGTGGGWADSSSGSFPDWVQIDFNGSKTIDEVDVFTVQDNYANPSEPTETMTFSLYGNTAFEVQYWNGSAWVDVPNGNVTGNNKVWRKFNFTALTTSKIRVLINDSPDHLYSRLTEVEAWGTNSGGSADPYTQNFIQWALSRQPNSEEINYWEDILRAAYAHGQGSLLLAEREMGRTIFESAEYAARGRSDHLYVYDLYKAYLMREPDSSGWAYWEERVPWMGRDQVRRGFDESTEFANLVSTLTISGTASSAVSSLATARVDPFNQPGSGLLGRDAEWSVPLLSLPGRAGLDLGLSLSYSSMVWTRSGPYVYFDEDDGFPSPGFRLGFPTIQEKFFDAQTGVNVYLLAAAGNRVELRQVGSSNVYEAADSSYLQLIDSGSLVVRTTDGTKLSYAWFDHEYRCIEIKDRNGNYLTVNYDWRGDITNLTDTLGRVITFNYDGNANPISITQTRNGQPHTWATFSWGTVPMQPSISGAVGTYNGEVIPVITMVGSDDGTYSKFAYNGSGQVTRITHYASDSNPPTDNHELAHTVFNYGAVDDPTRLSNTHVSAENWTGLNDVPSEVVTQYGIEGDAHTLGVVGDPNGTVYKEFYGTGWQHGLSVQSQVWSGGSQQKVSTTAWTQDNTNANYQTNPRVTETNVIDDAGNHSRTTIGYNTFTLPSGTSCSLPSQVDEYEANATVVARRTHTDYNLDANYLNARLIGLPQAKFLYEGTATLRAKITHGYDWGGEYLQNLPATAIQHDGAYTTDYVVGRGNLVDTLRWDVTDPNNSAKALEAKMGYDIDGSVVFARDALNHQTTISYNDTFSASGTNLDAPRSFATFAYPTTVTDPDGYSSSLWYKYDLGAKTRAQGAPPANPGNGIIQTFSYDDAARIQRVTTVNNGAYTRYEYGSNYVHSYATVNNVADEAYSAQIFDGLGRVIVAARNHPGSSGGFSAVVTAYDRMGRAIQQSNPTETSASGWPWQATGDDSVSGWIYTQQTYDWKGRPRITTNPSVTGNPNDTTAREASYSACGCAGSEVTTLTDEVGRQQKVYSDVLGRTAKTEVLNWDNTVYSTTVNSYNARDQVTLVRQFQGTDQSSVYQDTAMAYDGYGRLQTKHAPEQQVDPNNSSSTDHTTWVYNPDDTVASVSDARGASAAYAYNARHLATGITYSAPAGITATSNVTYGYDAAGNRTSMTDGLGSKSYNYNQLSQMMSETRILNDPNHPSINGTSRTLSYDYNLAGELKSLTDPAGSVVNYTHDVTGRPTNVDGTGYGSFSQFASNLQYRAWGGLKHLRYGNNLNLDQQYDSRMRISRYALTPVSPSSGQVNRAQDYQYSGDDRISLVHDEANNLFDRSYAFDQAGRLTQALTGHEARGEEFGPLSAYNETFQYDAFGNTTGRNTRWWSHQYNAGASYQNNRQPAYIYDSDGRVLADHQNTSYSKTINYTYDVRGLKTSARQGDNSNSATHDYDGDGQRVKIVATLTENSVTTTTTTYEISSSVLAGAVIEEVDGQGTKTAQHVYTSSGIELASGRAETTMVFKHRDPVTSVEQLSWTNAANSGRTEFDPLAGDVGEYEPVEDDPGRDFPMSVSHPSEPMNLCVLDGLPSDCPAAQSFGRESSTTSFVSWMDAPHGSVAMLRFRNRAGEERRLAGYLQLMPDGGMGYVPIGAAFDGDHFFVPLDNGAHGMGLVSKLYAGGIINFNPQQTKTEEHGLTVYRKVNDPRGGSYLPPCADDVFTQMGFRKLLNLDDVRIHIGIPGWVTEAAKKAGGIVPKAITMGYDIYFSSMDDLDFSKDHVVGTLALIGHELTHVYQFQKYGDKYYLAYFGQWVNNGFKYGGKFEEDGARNEALLVQSIPQRFGNDPCRDWRH